MLKRENEIISKWHYGSVEKPIVTIRVTTYNHEKFIKQNLDGILSQNTEFAYKILIHDDASTDRTVEIIQTYAEKYPQLFICIFEKENQYSKDPGQIGRIMQPYCKSEYLAFCEGDDYWIDENKIQKQLRFLMDNSKYSAVYCNILPVNIESKYDENLRGMYKELNEDDYTKADVSSGTLKTQTGTLTCKNFYTLLDEYDIEKFFYCKANGDEKMLVLLSSLGKIHYLSDVMVAHRRVLDTGDSYNARINLLTNAHKQELAYFRLIELAKLYEYFHKEKPLMWDRLIKQRYLARIGYLCAKDKNDREFYSKIIKDKTVYHNADYFSYVINLIRRRLSRF